MSKFIKQITGRSKAKQSTPKSISCNYSNNYYGDQVCRPDSPQAEKS